MVKMNELENKLLDIMHRHGKILSCDKHNLTSIDKLFLKSIVEIIDDSTLVNTSELENRLNNVVFKMNDYKARYFKLKSKLDKLEKEIFEKK